MHAIKLTLYRTSGESAVVDALVDAALAGKQVLVVVEIKARFDEQANIRWARQLEQAGCHVVYGLVGLKTHCKLALVVRAEPDGRLRRYVHVGTGNYNPKTARFYEDIGLLTADEHVGADVADLFNHLSGYTRQPDYDTLLVAPDTLRSGSARPRRDRDAQRRGRATERRLHQGEQPRRRGADRRALRRVPGRRARRPPRARHVQPATRRARAVGERPGAQPPRPLPRALPGLPVRRRR